jgi:hypothetical protein
MSRSIGDCNQKLDRTVDVFKYKLSDFQSISTMSDGVSDVYND